MSPIDKAIKVLGSRTLSVWLLIAGALYALLLAILAAFALTPPAFYMVWAPFAALSALFLVNLAISLLTRKYAHAGNLAFHAAFILVAAGVAVSAFYRFEGDALVLEGDMFYGEKGEYAHYSSNGPFERLAPDVSFRLDKITPGYWNDELYFIRLDASVSYPAGAFDKKEVLRLNGGTRLNGARLRISGYGLFPEAVIRQAGRLISTGPIRTLTFPPGVEDSIDINGHKVYLKVFTDPEFKGLRVVNRGMTPKDPLFLLRVRRNDNELSRTVLKMGEPLNIGDISLTFNGLKPWVRVSIVKDPGENMVYAGFVLGITGLVSRLLSLRKGRAGAQ